LSMKFKKEKILNSDAGMAMVPLPIEEKRLI
jgi:hypothetical protein